MTTLQMEQANCNFGHICDYSLMERNTSYKLWDRIRLLSVMYGRVTNEEKKRSYVLNSQDIRGCSGTSRVHIAYLKYSSPLFSFLLSTTYLTGNSHYHIYTEFLPGYTADSTVNSRQYEAELLDTSFQICVLNFTF